MKASRQTLKKFIKGALFIRDEGAYICPLKYEEEQIKMFEAADWGWHWRSQFSSGTRIELKTDATELYFDVYAEEFSSSDCTVDIYVDGVLHAVAKIEKPKLNRICYQMGEGWKLVQIYLPTDCHIGIKNFNINGAYKTVKDKGEKVLIIGDSITQGYGTFMSGATYANALQRKTGYNLVAQGIGGLPFKDCALYKGEYEPDKIIVALGTNYYDAIDVYDYEKETVHFFKKLNELWGDKEIVYISPLWRDNDVDWQRFNWCIETAVNEALKYDNITVIDGFDLVPHVHECYADKIHPNAYGSELYASNLAFVLKELDF